MSYTFEDIEKILDFKTWSKTKKIDELLRIDCQMYTNLGTRQYKNGARNYKKTISFNLSCNFKIRQRARKKLFMAHG